MNVNELKEYIIKHEKAIELLEIAGCINPRHMGGEVRAGRVGSSNDTGIVVREDLSGSLYSSSKTVNGDIITLLMEILGLNFLNALKWIHKVLGLKFNNGYTPPVKKSSPLDIFTKVCSRKNNNREIEFLDEKILSKYEYAPHIEMVREGLHPDVMMRFGVRFDYNTNRVIFPYRYWSNGKLIGLTGRTLVKDYDLLGIPKYKIYKNCPKTMNLYGLWENYQLIQEEGYVIVVEGEKSAIKMTGWGYPTVALSGWDISDEQIKILIGLNVEIIIALDNDIEEDVIKETCDHFKSIRTCKYIYDDEGYLDAKDSPCDKGKAIFQQLLENAK